MIYEQKGAFTVKIDNSPVSDNVMRIIKEKGYKQCAIAHKAGYSRQVFGNMVNNNRVIRPQDIKRIADALDVEAGELFESITVRA